MPLAFREAWEVYSSTASQSLAGGATGFPAWPGGLHLRSFENYLTNSDASRPVSMLSTSGRDDLISFITPAS